MNNWACLYCPCRGLSAFAFSPCGPCPSSIIFSSTPLTDHRTTPAVTGGRDGACESGTRKPQDGAVEPTVLGQQGQLACCRTGPAVEPRWSVGGAWARAIFTHCHEMMPCSGGLYRVEGSACDSVKGALSRLAILLEVRQMAMTATLNQNARRAPFWRSRGREL